MSGSNNFDYFRFDDSATGIYELTGVAPPKPDKSNPKALAPIFSIQRMIGVRKAQGGADDFQERDFVKCDCSGFTFYLKVAQFNVRVRGDLTTYQKDWEESKDHLSCDAWDEHGRLCSEPGSKKWPAKGIVSSLPRITTPNSWLPPNDPANIKIPVDIVDMRRTMQIGLWKTIASGIHAKTGTPRLWRPKGPIDPLTIYFSPTAAWLTLEQLQKIVDILTAEEAKKNVNTQLMSWLKFSAISQDDAQAKRVSKTAISLSEDLLKSYETLIDVGDSVERLAALQVEGLTSLEDFGWLRVEITENQATALQLKISAEENPKRISKPIVVQSLTHYTGKKSGAARKDAGKIMGGQSANDWAKDILWREDKQGRVAEWLHRSAYSFGVIETGDYQSSQNIVFGTYQANSDMTRAETMIRAVVEKTIATSATLTTTVVNSGTYAVVDNKGDQKIVSISPWMSRPTGKLSWLAPKLSYTGTFVLPTGIVDTLPRWETAFHTLSCRSPLSVEGKMDKAVLNLYLTVHPQFTLPSKKTKQASDDLNLLPFVKAKRVKKTPNEDEPIPQPKALSFVSFMVMSPLAAPVPAPITAMLAAGTRDRSTRRFTKNPIHQKAWTAASKQADQLQLGKTKVTSPRIEVSPMANSVQGSPRPNDAAQIQSITPPATGFVLGGTIDLFGLTSHPAKLTSWHGPPPPGVVVNSETPVYQHVEIDSIFASDFIPLLGGTPFKQFEFQKVTFTYQNYAFIPSKPIGWSMVAEICIDERYGMAHGVLTKTLNIPFSALTLKVSAALGLGHNWSSLPVISSFSVQGVLQLPPGESDKHYKGVKLCDGVALTRIGLRLFGVSSRTFGAGGTTTMNYGFGIFGDLNLVVPASVKPLEFDFNIEEFAGVAQLNASIQGDIWSNAFGSGFDLESVCISASISPEAPAESLDFRVQALMRAGATSAVFSGNYSSGGEYSISAIIDDFSCDGVVDLFRHYTGDELALPTHTDITIGSATIIFAKSTGLTIDVKDVRFDRYASSNGIIHISSTGVSLSGNVADVDFPEIPDVNLVNASLQVSFEKTGSAKSTDVALAGDVHVDGLQDLKISGAVHLYKATEDSKELDYTIYGSFSDPDTTSSLGGLIPLLKGTFVGDLTLQALVFVAASKDDPVLSSMNPQQYPIHQGIQICAVFGQIVPFQKLLRRPSDSPGLTLCAGYTKKTGYSLDIAVPADIMIHLGRGITTDPITMQIQTSPKIQLMIDAGVKIPVSKSPEPLDFQLSLTLVDDDITVDGQMYGLWKDPFGVSEAITIGPDLALDIGINLPIFFASGLPSTMGFVGDLYIGEATGRIGVQVSEDPTQEVLSGTLTKLSVQDVVAFLRDVTQVQIPTPPDFLDFEQVVLYMSTGVTIGSVSYPAGFSFEADLKIFGAQLKSSANITDSALIVKAELSTISIGPLSLTGYEGKNATFDLEFGPTTQKLTVDGALHFLDIEVALFLELEILPTPKFQFDFVLHFTQVLTFSVDATMSGPVSNLRDLSGLDFSLHAEFEQHVLDYVRDSVVSSLEAAKKNATAALQDAQLQVSAEKAKMLNDIENAKVTLQAQYQSWLQHSNAIHNASGAVIDKYMSDLKALQDDIDAKRIQFNLDIKAAEGKVQQANADRADKVRAAQAAVTKAKADWDNDVATKEQELEQVKVALNRDFGHAEQDIQDAENKVNSLQADINSINGTIADYENAHWYEFWKRAAIPALYVSVGTLEVSKHVADGILDVCEDVIKGTQYLTAKGAIPLAEDALAVAQKAGDEGFNAAQLAVQAADKATAEIIAAADAALDAIQHGGDTVWRGAESALNAFVNAQKTVLLAAKAAIDDLVNCAEWLAYQTANAALDVAQHATNALDIVNKALDVAQAGENGILNIAEDVINAAMNLFNITKIELGGSMKAFLGASGGEKHFVVTIEGVIAGKAIRYDNVELNLGNTAQFVHAIFLKILDELK